MRDIDLKAIGKRIQNRRKQRGYTQEQLADLLDVSIQMISNLERGNKSIRIENLVNLCDVLDVSTDFILTGKESIQDIHASAAKLLYLSEKDRKMIEMLIEYCTN